MKKFVVLLCLSAVSSIASAKPAFTGPDFGGIYDCTGNDEHEGKYTGTVTRVPVQGIDLYGAYSFKLEAPGPAAAHGACNSSMRNH